MRATDRIPVTARPRRRPGRSALLALLPVLLLAACAGTTRMQKHPGLMYQSIDAGSAEILATVAGEAARAGLPPVQVTFDARQGASSDYRLDLQFSFRDKPMHDTEVIWTITTIAALGVYPSTCGHYEFALNGDLYDRDGTHLKSWRITENDTDFLWMWVGNDCGLPDIEARRDVAAGLLEELYAEMAADPSWTAASLPPTDAPLVFVEAWDAETITEQVLRTERPFPNWSVDPQSAPHAELVLRLVFEYAKTEQTLSGVMGRGMASIMTIGLVSVCPPHRIVLKAQLMDSTGAVLRDYEHSDKVRSSALDDCALPAPGTHPDVERKLLKRLFGDIARDDPV